MQTARTRFSHRHLLALCTFLVPLAILAGLGWSELQRTGALAEAALEREGRTFVASAKKAIEQELARYLPPILDESEALLTRNGLVRTSMVMAAQRDHAALRGIVLLDDQMGVVEPALPSYTVNLPLSRALDLGSDNPYREGLQAVDLLLQREQFADATRLLEHLVGKLEVANPRGERAADRSSERRFDLDDTEIVVRYRLATVHLRVGAAGLARTQFENVKRLIQGQQRRRTWTPNPLGLLTELALAELGGPEDRLQLLREIAANRHDSHPDGFLSGLAQRLGATFAAESRDYQEVEELLREESLRATIRSFAAAYEQLMKPFLRYRRTRQPGGEPEPAVMRQVATIHGELALVCVRPATEAEKKQWNCSSVGLYFDLRVILGATFEQFALGNTFALAVLDPDDQPLVPPPTEAPKGYEAPTAEIDGLTLAAYPADPAQLLADAQAARGKRTLLILFLFVTALGGALWSWRSVSREAELASLKVDLVSRVSHELKTPLALVRMYGETLGMGRARDSDQVAEFGSIIARESERLTTLIQRILDFSRQQAGTLTYAPATVDLGELLRQVATTYAPHLESRGVMLIDSLPHGIHVQCDANAAESAIVNLLENAAKYGQEGPEEHEVDLELSRQGDSAIVEVKDRGRGIPAGEHARVFEGFYRATNSGEVRGAGLGLSLVRHFARAHGGEITAMPRDGGGTVMKLSLPIANVASDSAVSKPHDTPL